eukprot:m.248422 g.248422  ORF g.248422 m.248422 type:complete len:73 (-) comp90764_c0_seq1:119-337(-)
MLIAVVMCVLIDVSFLDAPSSNRQQQKHNQILKEDPLQLQQEHIERREEEACNQTCFIAYITSTLSNDAHNL